MKSKHEGMDYDNLFGIGIPDLLLNMLSCHVFLNNNESIVILKWSSSHVNWMNPLLKYYSDILLGHLSITIDSLLFKNPCHDNIFNNISGIPIPNKIL